MLWRLLSWAEENPVQAIVLSFFIGCLLVVADALVDFLRAL